MEGQTERENRVTLKEARYILNSRTKAAEAFRQIVHSLYLDHIKRQTGTAPNKDAVKEKSKDGDLLNMVKEARAEQAEILEKLKRMNRNLYEKQTGQKWRPSLRVLMGGDNTTQNTPIVNRHSNHKQP